MSQEEFGPAHPNYLVEAKDREPEAWAGTEFTQPEPINHNELKRLLIEVFDDITETLFLPGYHDVAGIYKLRRRYVSKIENAILDGDDS